jgi:hypothetical protein
MTPAYSSRQIYSSFTTQVDAYAFFTEALCKKVLGIQCPAALFERRKPAQSPFQVNCA